MSEPRADGADCAVRTHGLTKRFGRQVAVDRLELRVPRGAVYGFLGPNGSGKTTTLRMLLALVRPTAGWPELLGHPVPAAAGRVLPRVGALVEGPAFHPYLSGRDNLLRLDAADRFADPATARRRVDRALDRVGLLPAARKRYRAYSLGMRQRLALAGTQLVPRELLVLDEPTNGLDPQGTREVRALVGGLAAEGVTVLLSTHLLSEVEQVCTHVGVMHAGRLLTEQPLAELRSAARTRIRVRTPDGGQAAAVLRRFGVHDVRVDRDGAGGMPNGTPPEDLVRALVTAGVPVQGFERVGGGLEEVFVELTGEGFDVRG